MSITIVPKHLAKGVDLCGVGKLYYIVRSDLACYMTSTNINTGEDLEIFGLHPSCRGGDHYLAHKNGLFYIIKSNYYRRVKNLNTDEHAVVYIIHPRCQGGDHYMSAFDYFYIIYQSRGIYHRTKNLNTDENGEEFLLNPNCKYGLYYFGIDDSYYFMKPNDQSGVHYVKCKNYNTDKHIMEFSFHSSVINFLPGGLGITMGPAYGEWILIDSIINYSEIPLKMHKTTSRKIGFEKERMSSMEHNWKVSATVTEETGGLTALITKSQFSLMAEHGGCNVNTDKETWNEATHFEMAIAVDVNPHHEICIWIYQLGLGKEPLLYCRDMKILDSWNLPVGILLPSATN